MGIGALGVTGIAAMALGVSLAEAIRRIVFAALASPENKRTPHRDGARN
ncbi:DUF1515 family protein [Ensifer sp. 1H6]|nr:DUF1515 family protein [Ensifer sp. 1H6]